MTNKEPQPGEYIWTRDFNNPNIAGEIAWLGCQTYGQLAAAFPDRLFDETQLDESEISVVRYALLRRGLLESED